MSNKKINRSNTSMSPHSQIKTERVFKDQQKQDGDQISEFKDHNIEATSTVFNQKSQYYVSNQYVEKIFDNTIRKIDTIREGLESRMNKCEKLVQSLLDIREKELPYYNEKIKFVESRCTKVFEVHIDKIE